MPDRTTPDEGGKPDEGKTTAGAGARTLTQEELDAIVESRLRRERSKFADYDELKEKAGKLDKIEADGASELEKANKRADDADRRAETAEGKALRLEIALEKGLTATQAKRLVGKDRDELETDADELVEAFGGAAKGGDGKTADEAGKKPAAATDGKPSDSLRRTPTENLRSGSVPDAEPQKSGKDIAAEIAKESEF